MTRQDPRPQASRDDRRENDRGWWILPLALLGLVVWLNIGKAAHDVYPRLEAKITWHLKNIASKVG